MAKAKKGAVSETAPLSSEEQLAEMSAGPGVVVMGEAPQTGFDGEVSHSEFVASVPQEPMQEVVFEMVAGGSFTSRALGISVRKGDVFATSDPVVIERLRKMKLFKER